MQSKDNVKDMRCVVCTTVTHHNLKYESTATYCHEDYDPETSECAPDYYEIHSYRVWSCAGCDMVRLEINSMPMGLGMDGEESNSVYYPGYNVAKVSAKSFAKISISLKAVYNEVIEAFNAGLMVLCSIGVRALLERVCIDKGINDDRTRSLEEKLHLLCDSKYVPPELINGLLSLKIMGDSAAHKLDAPKEVEIKLAIDFVEQVIFFIYELEEQLTSQAAAVGFYRYNEVRKLLDRREKRLKKGGGIALQQNEIGQDGMRLSGLMTDSF